MPEPVPPEVAPTAAPSPPPRAWPVYAVTAGLLAGMLFAGEFVAAALAPRPLSPLAVFLGRAGASVAWTLAVALVAAAFAGEGFAARLGLTRSRLGAGGTAIAVLGGLALSQALDLLLRLSGAGRGPALEQMITALAPARGLDLVLALLVVGVGAGAAEELFFRGWAQRRLVASYGAPSGIAIAAALFALAHGDPRHAAFAFGFGFFAGAVAHWSGSTLPAIALHATNNTIAVLGIVGGFDAVEARLPRIALATACVVLLALAGASLRAVRRRAAEWTAPTGLG